MSETVDPDARIIEQTPFPSAAMQQCPYPYYQALRETDPIHRLPGGEWVVTRHADIAQVLRNPEIFSSRHSMFDNGLMRAARLEELDNPTAAWGIVNSDPPLHQEKRLLAMDMFRPDRMNRKRGMIAAHADALIDAFIDRGHCNFAAEFADLLPPKVIMTLFGLPPEDLGRALEWRRYEGFGTRYATPERKAAGRDGILDLSRYIREVAEARAEAPGDDELSLHIQRHLAHHGRLDLPNVVAELLNLFIGGIITTTHLLSTTMRLLLENPEQLAKANTGATQLRNAIEEALRLDAPVQFSMRMVTRPTELAGTKLSPGDQVIVVFGSGNHDECVFKDAERFDIERDNVRSHLAFGGGPHLCLGARLGRMETEIGLERIFERLTNIRLAPGNDFANQEAVMFRGLASLEIEFDRA